VWNCPLVEGGSTTRAEVKLLGCCLVLGPLSRECPHPGGLYRCCGHCFFLCFKFLAQVAGDVRRQSLYGYLQKNQCDPGGFIATM